MTTDNPFDETDAKPAAPGEAAVVKAEGGPSFAEPKQQVRDLSAEIAKALPRGPGERVTCRWIAGDQYRCNWWGPSDAAGYDNPQMTGPTVTTHRVRRSQWLRATKSGKKLLFDPPQPSVA